jgi:hypothetical protein
MVIVWIWAKRVHNAGVVDIFWAFNFPVIGLLLFVLGQGYVPRKALIAAMVIIAGLRLGSHLGSKSDRSPGRGRRALPAITKRMGAPMPTGNSSGSSRYRPSAMYSWPSHFLSAPPIPIRPYQAGNTQAPPYGWWLSLANGSPTINWRLSKKTPPIKEKFAMPGCGITPVIPIISSNGCYGWPILSMPWDPPMAG